MTAAAGGPIAAWYDTRDGNGEIYLRALAADGDPAGPELRLTRDPEESYEASIDAFGDAVAVAWYDKAGDGVLTGRLGLWSRDGTPRWVTALPRHSRNPVLRTNGREIVVAWIQMRNDGSEAVLAGRWDAHGTPLGPPRQLGPAHSTTWNLNAALDANDVAWVVFDAVASNRASELFLARLSPAAPGAPSTGVSLQRLSRDDGRESKYPDIAVEDGRVALTWYDARDGNTEVYLWAGDAAVLPEDIDVRARRVTESPAESIGAYLAWNGERIGLAWSDASEGQHEVYFQPFDAAARPLAPVRRVTSNRTSSLIPAIEPWAGGFALAWGEYVPGSEPHGGTSEIAFAIVR